MAPSLPSCHSGVWQEWHVEKGLLPWQSNGSSVAVAVFALIARDGTASPPSLRHRRHLEGRRDIRRLLTAWVCIYRFQAFPRRSKQNSQNTQCSDIISPQWTQTLSSSFFSSSCCSAGADSTIAADAGYNATVAAASSWPLAGCIIWPVL
jgi:hypothetical protein